MRCLSISCHHATLETKLGSRWYYYTTGLLVFSIQYDRAKNLALASRTPTSQMCNDLVQTQKLSSPCLSNHLWECVFSSGRHMPINAFGFLLIFSQTNIKFWSSSLHNYNNHSTHAGPGHTVPTTIHCLPAHELAIIKDPVSLSTMPPEDTQKVKPKS